jgi:hypothetical protein
MDRWVEKLSSEDDSSTKREDASFYEQQLRIHNDGVQRLQNAIYQVIQRGQELHQVRTDFKLILNLIYCL